MIYLLDTNICIAWLKNDLGVVQRVIDAGENNVCLCSVVKSELWFGAFKSQQTKKNKANLEKFFADFKSLPFEDTSAAHFGEIRADLTKKGTPIGLFDMQIAAIALANDLTVVTNNTREFERVPNLKLEDWLISND